MRPPVIDDNPFKKVGEKTIEFDIYYQENLEKIVQVVAQWWHIFLLHS